MKPQSKKFFILTVLIMLSAFGAALFSTGCNIIGEEAVTENITDNGGTFPAAKMAEFSGSVSDAAAAFSPALKTSLNYAVSRAVELDANKNYIDVIDCATGLSVGTGSFGPHGTFTANVDILKHAGKNVMLAIGNKNAEGKNGPALYKCFLGRMPNLSELPDASLFDSVKIKNVNVTYETTAKALFAAEKELYNNPANAIFSFTTSEVQADKSVSKQHLIDTAFDRTIESASGGAANIAQVASAVKTIAVVASSNLSDGDKNNLIQQNIVSITDTLNAYARIVADSITNTAVSNIITQNSIPTEIKFETAGGTITIDSTSTNKPLTPEIIQNINPLKMVEAPVFNITDGEYNEAQTVIIKTPTEGATIVYTLDGTEPREGSGIKYDSPVKINKTAVIKAAAYKTGLVTSATVYLKIVITSVPVEPVEPVLASLSVQAIETQTAGKGFSFMVKALDQSGELAVNDKPVEIKLSAETPDVTCYASDSFAEKTAIATISGGMAKIYARGTKAGTAKIALTANGIEAAAYFEISAGPATKLAVTKEPSENAVAGVVLEQQPQVSLFDEFGNIASGPQTEVTASAGSVGTAGSIEVLFGTTKVKFVNGVASFDDLKFNAAGTFEIIFAAAELSAKSIAVKVAPAVFDKFDISSNSPQNTGDDITVKLTAFDSTGNIMKNYGGKTLLKLYNAAGNIKWSGAELTSASSMEAALESTAFINGIAQFNINNEKVESDVTIAATDAASDFGAKTSISWKPVAADHFEISNISGDIPAGSSVEIKITAKDKFSNTVIDFNSETKLSDLSGTITPAAAADFINGVWTGVVVMTKPAQANKINAVSGNLSGESASFNIVPGAPAAIVMLVQPSSNSYANIAFSTQPSVKIQDAFGNDVKTAEVSVTAALKAGISGTLGGTLTALTDADGIAKFSGLRYSGYGNISLEFNADGLTKAESDRITIIYLPLNPNLTSVTVNDTPKQGQVLTATPAYSNGAGTVTYLWSRSSDALGNTVTNSNLGTTGTYTLVAGDVGSYVFCVATASGSTTGGSKTSSIIGPVTPAVLLESGSVAGITADDTKITGLTATNKYVVITGGKIYGVTAGGTPGAENSDAAALTGTEIIGLTNGTVYKVTDVTSLVLLETGSLGTADNTKITGLTATNKYVVITGGKVYGVTADGTLGAENSDAAALTGTEITGLTNGTVYKAVDVTNLVLLETGSLGTANDTKITGLTTGKIYVVKTGANYYGVLADGTLFVTLRATAALAHADAAALTGTEITGLTNGTTYKVTEEALVSLASGSLGAEGDTKITGLTATNKYVVVTGGKVYGVTADGTLDAENSDAAALTGTEITGLTNGTVYKAVDVTNLVSLETGSLGTANDTKITGLTTGKIYVVKTGGNYYGVLANGTLFVTLRATATLAHADAVALSAGVTEITGLTNGTTYKVTEEALVSLASGSLGAEGDTKITGLTATSKYVVITGGKVYGVTADGTLGAENSDATALGAGVTEITGLTNGKTYKVIYSTTTVDSITYTYNGGVMAVTGSSATGAASILDSVSGMPVTSIGSSVFIHRTGLTGITIPNTVTSIGSYAFYGCTGLTSVTIPDSVTSIGDNAFKYCTGLTSITIPNSVTSIGDNAFYDCTGLTSITIPNSVTSIGDNAFYDCTGLTSVTIPDSVTNIGMSAFQGCTGLTSITIPSANIRNYAFYSCTGLTSITIGSGTTSIGSYAFQGCTGLASITIPDSVTSIGSCAFSNCTGLTSVSIGTGVTNIGMSAFQGCSNLTVANFLGNAPTLDSWGFSGCAADFKIHYLSSKTGWPTTPGSSWNGYPTIRD